VHAARCVGVPAAALFPSASYAGRGATLEASCCLTRRRRRAKHRLREREAVPQRQAVPIVAPSTRAPPASATALLLGNWNPCTRPSVHFPDRPLSAPGADPGVRGPPQRPSVPARADPRLLGPPPAHRPTAIRQRQAGE